MTAKGTTLSFLSSLQVKDPDEDFALHPEALYFVEDFEATKQELAVTLFSLYNANVFDNQIPSSVNLLWNGRLSSTAGYFSGRKHVIVLSRKIVTSPSFLLSTLIHEMCHAAVRFIDNKVGLPPHGSLWRKWAIKARNIYPEIPKITVTHNFKSTTEEFLTF